MLCRNKEDTKYIESTLKLAGTLQSQSQFVECIKVLSRLIRTRGNNKQIAHMAHGVLTQMKDLTPEQEALVSTTLRNICKY